MDSQENEQNQTSRHSLCICQGFNLVDFKTCPNFNRNDISLTVTKESVGHLNGLVLIL